MLVRAGLPQAAPLDAACHAAARPLPQLLNPGATPQPDTAAAGAAGHTEVALASWARPTVFVFLFHLSHDLHAAPWDATGLEQVQAPDSGRMNLTQVRHHEALDRPPLQPALGCSSRSSGRVQQEHLQMPQRGQSQRPHLPGLEIYALEAIDDECPQSVLLGLAQLPLRFLAGLPAGQCAQQGRAAGPGGAQHRAWRGEPSHSPQEHPAEALAAGAALCGPPRLGVQSVHGHAEGI
mmetsp:Transcript_47670/g.132664  ORF Transcript_47670/g.132664 Transcript_47670/m.132664 type:complete len:236 (-) Transcript_47670:693-1400(-)